MNKGLELIEASFLFDLPGTAIDIVVHPQSIVHSMVYYRDGSVLAQLANPDMRVPIAYGLAFPDRCVRCRSLGLTRQPRSNSVSLMSTAFPVSVWAGQRLRRVVRPRRC